MLITPGSATLHPGLLTFNPFGVGFEQIPHCGLDIEATPQPIFTFSHFHIFTFSPSSLAFPYPFDKLRDRNYHRTLYKLVTADGGRSAFVYPGLPKCRRYAAGFHCCQHCGRKITFDCHVAFIHIQPHSGGILVAPGKRTPNDHHPR